MFDENVGLAEDVHDYRMQALRNEVKSAGSAHGWPDTRSDYQELSKQILQRKHVGSGSDLW